MRCPSNRQQLIVTHFPPVLRGTWIILVLRYEPLVPAASERDCVEPGERLAFAIPLGAQCGDAGFNFGLPLSKAYLCLVLGCVGGQLQLGLSLMAIEP